VKIKELKESLKLEVESVVNYVGVDINTASVFLLRYISGLNKKTAWNIVNYRNENGIFSKRSDIKKVKGIGKKAYEQAAGFCRVPESKNPLDNSIIHPESYDIVKKIFDYYKFEIKNFKQDRVTIKNVMTKESSKDIAQKLNLNPITAEDIFIAILSDTVDPRDEFPQPILKKEVKRISDLKEGMIMQGTVRNVVDFGAFVDIGVKEDGMIHKSKFGKKNCEPLNEVYTGQIISTKILSIDKKRGRIGLELFNNRGEKK